MHTRELRASFLDMCAVQNFGKYNSETLWRPLGEIWNFKFLNHDFILYDFRSKFSCEMLDVTAYTPRPFDHSGPQSSSRYSNFRLFEKLNIIPHDHLLWKLQFYCVHGPLLDGMATSLKTQTQSVVAESRRSKLSSVLSGTTGSALGPLLFLLHITDILNIITSSVCLFMGDCILYHPICCTSNQAHIQRELMVLRYWGRHGTRSSTLGVAI